MNTGATGSIYIQCESTLVNDFLICCSLTRPFDPCCTIWVWPWTDSSQSKATNSEGTGWPSLLSWVVKPPTARKILVSNGRSVRRNLSRRGSTQPTVSLCRVEGAGCRVQGGRCRATCEHSRELQRRRLFLTVPQLPERGTDPDSTSSCVLLLHARAYFMLSPVRE